MIAVLLCLLLSLGGLPALADPPPPGSVIVPIDLKETSIKVVTTQDLESPDFATFDVGFNRELLTIPKEPQKPSPSLSKPKKGDPRRTPTQSVLIPAKPTTAAALAPLPQPPSNDFDVQRSYIHVGDKYLAVFKNDRSSATKDVMIGARISMMAKDHQAIVEIQPCYMLTDGTTGVLTTKAIAERREELSVRVAYAERIARTEGKLDKMQNVANRLETEAATFDEIARYAEAIAPVGRIYIRIHVEDREIPAAIKK
jgi:hypothetical protein